MCFENINLEKFLLPYCIVCVPPTIYSMVGY